MLVIMNNTLCISHYDSFGKHSKVSNFWVASDSLWVEPLLDVVSMHIGPQLLMCPCAFLKNSLFGWMVSKKYHLCLENCRSHFYNPQN